MKWIIIHIVLSFVHSLSQNGSKLKIYRTAMTFLIENGSWMYQLVGHYIDLGILMCSVQNENKRLIWTVQ